MRHPYASWDAVIELILSLNLVPSGMHRVRGHLENFALSNRNGIVEVELNNLDSYKGPEIAYDDADVLKLGLGFHSHFTRGYEIDFDSREMSLRVCGNGKDYKLSGIQLIE